MLTETAMRQAPAGTVAVFGGVPREPCAPEPPAPGEEDVADDEQGHD